MTPADELKSTRPARRVDVPWTSGPDGRLLNSTSPADAAEEREKIIVAWLRGLRYDMSQCPGPSDIADAIERGEHLKGSRPMIQSPDDGDGVAAPNKAAEGIEALEREVDGHRGALRAPADLSKQ